VNLHLLPLADWIGYAAAFTDHRQLRAAGLADLSAPGMCRGISLGMYSVFAVGVALWLAYGLVLGAWPIVVANAITLALALAILAMKLRFR
jgi:MtN3 and saliva related transmembrane protein